LASLLGCPPPASAEICSGSLLHPSRSNVASLADAGSPHRTSLGAVLPFKNLSGDVGQDFFSDGITEDVITALARFSNLLVIAKSASFPFKGSNTAPAEIGRSLDARYLLDGSIRRAGDRVRVNVGLTEGRDRTNRFWSETYDAEVKDIFTVQDDIAKRVVGAAAVKLTRFEQERILAKPTANLAAYEYVLRGRSSCRMQRATRTTKRPRSSSTRSTSTRAMPLPMRARRVSFRGRRGGMGGISRRGARPREELAQKAQALDPATTSAYRLLAIINMYKRRYDLALGRSTARSRSIQAMQRTTGSAEPFWCGRVEQQRVCRGSKARSALTGPMP